MFNNKISDKDISILIQGPYDDNTLICIDSVRSTFPHSPIILSTWESSNISGLENVNVVINKDPGAISFIRDNDKPNNLNRLIFSTQMGLKRIKSKYTLKLRSDLMLENRNFLNYFDRFALSNEFKIFKNKLLVSDMFTLYYEIIGDRKVFTPFHVSDWWYFGYTSDIEQLYSCSLVKEPMFSKYFDKLESFYLINNVTRQMSSEQYILFSLVKSKFNNIEFIDSKHVTDLNNLQSKKIIASNFIPLDPSQSGIRCLKQQYSDYKKIKNSLRLKAGLISFEKWQKEFYEIYCK